MANDKVISTQALIEKFQYALDNDWGYIYGTAGELWTAADQVRMNQTTDSNREFSRKYGSKWIGHHVADCSGLFYWAFKELGSYMYHGSDTMFRKWTVASGELKNGLRSDGKELLPGTAVFTYKTATKKYGHVGLYIGNGIVIEAHGTKAGVITSKTTDWGYWGELKNVDYGKEPEPLPEGTAVVTGKRVALRTAPTTQASIIMRIDTGKRVEIETPPPSEWEYVSYQGKTGWMMKQFIRES